MDEHFPCCHSWWRLVSPGRTICADSCLPLLETSLQRQHPLPPTQIIIIIVAYSILSRDVSYMPTHSFLREIVRVNLNCEETPTVHFLTVVTELFFLVSRYFSCCYHMLLWSDVSVRHRPSSLLTTGKISLSKPRTQYPPLYHSALPTSGSALTDLMTPMVFA